MRNHPDWTDDEHLRDRRQLEHRAVGAGISSSDFDEYWRYLLACEYQRLYPGIKQSQHALAA